MFILIGTYFIANGSAAAQTQSLAAAGAVRSESTEVALPPQIGCSSSHAGHAGHEGH